MLPVNVIDCDRSGSYMSRIDACANTSLPTPAGWSGLPSTLVGRPSWLSTSTGVAYPPNGIALAKNNGRPSVIGSGCRTYGTMGSSGCFTHADSPASAIEAVISFMKSRRDAPSGHTDACRGNSRCTISKNPSVWDSSSRLRQYCGPLLVRASWSRTSASSSLLGQTASDLFWPSLSIFSSVPVRISLLFRSFASGHDFSRAVDPSIVLTRRADFSPRGTRIQQPPLAVAGVTARYVLHGANVVLRLQR